MTCILITNPLLSVDRSNDQISKRFGGELISWSFERSNFKTVRRRVEIWSFERSNFKSVRRRVEVWSFERSNFKTVRRRVEVSDHSNDQISKRFGGELKFDRSNDQISKRKAVFWLIIWSLIRSTNQISIFCATATTHTLLSAVHPRSNWSSPVAYVGWRADD